ncbi:MAG: AraC family transcriptional regulator [Lachnospiraceae bacterium]|nr:AraC family transcriptional regulator [Lachnospiraceae bacterium]
MSEAFSEKIEFPLKVTHNITEKKSTRLLHIHDNGFELLFFIAGKVTYFYETSIYTMQPGDILLVPPDTIHGYQTHEDSYYERIPLHIQRNLMLSLSTEKTSLLDAFQDPEHRIVHLSKPEMNQFIYYTDTIIKLNEEKPYGYDILTHAYLLILLLIVNTAYRNTYSTAKDISPAVIRNALDYINAHLTDNLTVQSIADELGISSSRLSHLFKEHTGSSVWNYVMVKRLLLARALLMEGKAVIDACYESGFRDYSHFNKAFSKTFHIAPGRFLKEQHLAETV